MADDRGQMEQMPDQVAYGVPGEATQPEPEQTDDERWRRRAGWFALAVIVALIIWWLLQFIAVVPTTLGMTRARSVHLIEQAGFRADVTTVTAGERVPGRVVGQAPAQGWYLVFWPVDVMVTGGVELGDVGLEPDYGDSDEYYLDEGVGGDGTRLPNDGEEMDPLVTPTFDDELIMPNVQNLSQPQALQALRRVGLRVVVRRGPSMTDVGGGRVYYQNPSPGTLITVGQRASLWVSTGPFDKSEGDVSPYPNPPGP